MDPFTISALFIAGGSLLSAYGSIEEGKAAMEAATYNANTMRIQAGQVREKSTRDASLVRERGIEAISDMRASYAASGVAMQGSVLDVLADSAGEVKRDELTVRYQGELQARSLEADSNRVLLEGRQAQRAGNINAIGSLLQGAGSIAGKKA
jgi:hypothetical protein